MHQPNIFLNSYLGYTMWDYESDAPQMWPGPDNTAPRPPGMSDEDYQKKYKQQRYPTAAEVHQALEVGAVTLHTKIVARVPRACPFPPK